MRKVRLGRGLIPGFLFVLDISMGGMAYAVLGTHIPFIGGVGGFSLLTVYRVTIPLSLGNNYHSDIALTKRAEQLLLYHDN